MVGSARRAKVLEEIIQVLGPRSRPDVRWISRVTGRTTEEAARASNEITDHRAAIVEISQTMRETGRSYYAQFPAPIDLYALVRLSSPRRLVESGVASGISSALLLLGIRSNSLGTLHSIDLPVTRRRTRGGEPWALPAGRSSGWGVPKQLHEGWDLRLGRSEELLESLLEELGGLDFYCHDSPVDAKHFRFEMSAIMRYLGPGALVVADNTDRDIFDETARSLGTKAFYRKGSTLGGFKVPGEGSVRLELGRATR